MNLFKNTSLFAGIVLTLLSLFACATKEVATDGDAGIAEFDLPAGYIYDFDTSVLGYTVEAYKGQNGPSHLYLIQSEKQSDGNELAKMLSQLAPGSSNLDTRITVIETHTAKLRGQDATVVISEGINSENVRYRQITVAFEGNGGPALLVFSESVDAWDQEVVDAFLESIH